MSRNKEEMEKKKKENYISNQNIIINLYIIIEIYHVNLRNNYYMPDKTFITLDSKIIHPKSWIPLQRKHKTLNICRTLRKQEGKSLQTFGSTDSWSLAYIYVGLCWSLSSFTSVLRRSFFPSMPPRSPPSGHSTPLS